MRVFEDRALRTLVYVGQLRGWEVDRKSVPWTLRTPDPLRVTCSPDVPTAESVQEFVDFVRPRVLERLEAAFKIEKKGKESRKKLSPSRNI